jgi:excisionase family DNA binding protein
MPAVARDPDVLTADEAAALLGVSRRSVYNAVERGEVPSYKVGNLIRFRRSTLDAWRTAQENAAHAALQPRRGRRGDSASRLGPTSGA